MKSSSAPSMCGYQWTTGYGPDDPDDTGVHKCVRPERHGEQRHVCSCGRRLTV
jgi:hypothetical protein